MTLKPVPPKKKVKVVSFNKEGLKNLGIIVKGLEDGSIEDAVIIYKKDEETYYIALTDSSFETLGWMLHKANVCMVIEDGESEEG